MQVDEIEEGGEAVTAPVDGIGARLMAERERQGLSRKDIGERTKIPERHLESMEAGRLHDLPGRTYAIGFARGYARALGMDEGEVVDAVREELGVSTPQAPSRNLDYLEPGDPARIPSSKLAWGVGALLVALVIAAIFVWRGFFMPAADMPPLAEPEEVTSPAVPAATASAPEPEETSVPAGEVTFTAKVDGIWVKFYDRHGRQLFQKQMALNETFTIPEDAQGPQLWTGRPDALSITIGGREVAPLATTERTIRNVPVDAASLTARVPGPGVPTPATR